MAFPTQGLGSRSHSANNLSGSNSSLPPLELSSESVNKITGAFASKVSDVNEIPGEAQSKQLQKCRYVLPQGPDANLLCQGFSDEQIQTGFKNYLKLCSEVASTKKSLKRHDDKLQGKVQKYVDIIFDEIVQNSVFGISLLSYLLSKAVGQLTEKNALLEPMRVWMQVIGDTELKSNQKVTRIFLSINQLKMSKEKEFKKLDGNLAFQAFMIHVQRLYFMRRKYRDWATLIIFKSILCPQWTAGSNYKFCSQLYAIWNPINYPQGTVLIDPKEVLRTFMPHGVLLPSSIRIKFNEFLNGYQRNAKGDIEVVEPRFFFLALMRQIISVIPEEHQPEYSKEITQLDAALNEYFTIDASNIQPGEETAIRTELKKYTNTLKEDGEEYKKKSLEEKRETLVIALRLQILFTKYPLFKILPLMSFNTLSEASLKQVAFLKPVCDWTAQLKGSARYKFTLDQKHGTHVHIIPLLEDGILLINRIRKFIFEKIPESGGAALPIASFSVMYQIKMPFKNFEQELSGGFQFLQFNFEKDVELPQIETFVEKMIELANTNSSD